MRCAPLLVWREGIDESMAEATRDWLSTALVKRGSLDVDGQASLKGGNLKMDKIMLASSRLHPYY
jgi:hypothetical protein